MKKILAIDDQQDNLTTIKAAIKNNMSDCLVLTALSGKEGIKIARKKQPDVILLDIIMPKMDGFETCDRLKKDELTKHIPVVMVTAIKTDTESRIKGLNLGADAFLSKPIDAVELSAQVNVMFRIKEAEDKLRAEKEVLEETVLERNYKLKESEKKYKTLYENTPLSYHSLNEDGSIKDVNPAWLSTLGYKLEEVIGKWFRDFLHPDWKAQFEETFSEFKKCGYHHNNQFKIQHKNGHYLDILSNGTIGYYSNGSFKQTYCLFQDITLRKQAEDALRESEHTFNAFTSQSTEGISVVDLDGNYTYVNPAFCEMVGWTEEELLQMTVFDVTADKQDTDTFKRTKTVEEGMPVIVTLVRKNKTEFIAEITGKNLSIKGKKRVLGTIRDITERMKAEEKLVNLHAWQEAIFEGSRDAIFVSNTDSQFVMVNHAACQLTAYSKNELLQMKITDLHESQDLEAYSLFHKRIMNGEEILTESKIKKKDGQKVDTEFNNKKIKIGEVFYMHSAARDISGRKQAEIALSESEARFRNMFETNHAIMLLINPDDGKIQDANPAACKYYGYSYNKFIDKLYIQNINSLSDNEIKDEMQAALKANKNYFNFKHKLANGKIRDVEVYSSKTTIKSKELLYSIIHDITDRKLAEERIIKEKNKAQQYLNIAEVMLLSIDSSGIVQLANPKACEILGYSENEILGKNWFDNFLPLRLRKDVKAVSKKVFSDEIESVKYYENEILTKSGEERLIAWNNSDFRDGKGNIFGILSSGEDITERKNAEKKLHESELKFRLLADFTYDWEYWQDENGKYVYLSPSCKRITGYSSTEFYENPDLLFELVHPDDYEKVYEHYHSEDEKHNQVGHIEFQIINRQGQTRWIEHHCTPVFNKEDEFLGRRGNNRDITERKKVEKNLQESENRYHSFINHSREGIYRLEMKKPIDISLAVEEQIMLINKNAYYAECNDAFVKMYQAASADEIINKQMSDFYDRRKDPVSHANIQKFIDSGYKLFDAESLELTKDGEIQWFSNQSIGVVENGKLIRIWGTQLNISDRKKANKELIESRDQYEALFNQIADPVIVFDKKTEMILHCNSVMIDHYGFTLDELKDMTPLSLHHENDNLEIAKKNLIDDTNTSPNEYLHQAKDGSIFNVETHTQEIIYNNREAWITIIRDITERKHAEKALHESAEKYRVLYTSTNDSIFLMQNYTFISCNPKTLEMYGCKEEEIIGHTPMEFSPKIQPNGKSSMKLAIQKMNACLTGKPQTFQWLHHKKDGTPFNAEVTLTKMVLPDGEYVHAIVRDITERKRAEQIQKVLFNISNTVLTSNNVQELISVIKEYLESIIDTKNIYIGLYDKASGIIKLPFVADQFDEIEEFPAEKSMTGHVIKTKKSLFVTSAQQEEMVAKGILKFVGTKSKVWLGVPLIINNEVQGALVVQSYDNEDAYNKSDLEILEFVSDQISLSIHRKNAEQNLKDALKKATESDRLKSTFLATMSHELRTPLNAIIGFSDIIDENLPINEIVKFSKTINDSGNHLLNIVEDLFDITLIESGQIKIIKEDFKLVPILNNVHEIIKAEQKKTGKEHLDLKLLIPANMVDLIVNTDRAKFKQILINLLKNATKFTDKGEVSYGFEEVIIEHKSFLKFFVKDTGIGIHQDQQKLIFDIFRQADETYTTTHGGTGIGLSITKKLTELMGGNIWLKSKKGKGSTFYFTIPNKQPEALDENNSIKNIKTASLNTKTILIVEDIEASYQLLEAMLSKLKVNLIWAKNGEEAVSMCKEDPKIDLILMDINMPIMNGYDATRLIKKFRPKLPIIAQTAYAISGDKEKSLEAGCDDYISKPIKKDILLAMIKRLIIKT